LPLSGAGLDPTTFGREIFGQFFVTEGNFDGN
jgi:hypothetical protein